jgi:hypothetical protein
MEAKKFSTHAARLCRDAASNKFKFKLSSGKFLHTAAAAAEKREMTMKRKTHKETSAAM